jgi:hypothetical protein
VTDRERRGPIAFAMLCAALVILANLGAWRGYFQGDDLDTLGWMRYLPASYLLKTLATPLYLTNNFRPVGFAYYDLLLHAAGLHFAWYVAALQAIHLLNVWLAWKLIRALGASAMAAALGTLFFSFHMAAIDAYWKPQFIFDVLCGTFSLACLVLFVRRRFVWSLVCLWLAYKSKELAVMLPFVLAAYEFLLGERRSKPLLPFFVIALSFGLQGVLIGHHAAAGTLYALHFTWKTLGLTSSFYFSKIFMARWIGFGVLVIPPLVRDRRAWFGLAAFLLILVPLFPLSGRLGDVYLYVPLVGLAIMISAIAESRRGAMVIAAFLLLWLPWNYLHSRSGRRYELAVAAEDRAYVDQARRFIAAHPDADRILVAGWPAALNSWGARGAFRLLDDRLVDVHDSNEPAIDRILGKQPAVAEWNASSRLIEAGMPANLSYLLLTDPATIFQLGDGWGQVMNYARWFDSQATASVSAAPGDFVCTLRLVKRATSMPVAISVRLNGHVLGSVVFDVPGDQSARWPVAKMLNGPVPVEFRVDTIHDGPVAQVIAFGFR